jgi:hypothetical protein
LLKSVPDQIVYVMMTSRAARTQFAGKTMCTSGIGKSTATTWVGLTEVNAKAQTDGDSNGFVVETQSAIKNWECIQPVASVRCRNCQNGDCPMHQRLLPKRLAQKKAYPVTVVYKLAELQGTAGCG